MAVLQMLLLLCAGSSLAEDLFLPNVNIIAELEKLKNMDERIQKLEESLAKVLSENEAKKVAFSAGLLESGTGYTGPTNSVKTLVYKKVFSNIGGAYDSNTGVFTAPIKGAYYFRFYGHSHGGTTMAVSLLKNGTTQCSMHAWKPASNGSRRHPLAALGRSGKAGLGAAAGSPTHTDPRTFGWDHSP